MVGGVTGLPRGAGRPLPPRCKKALLRYRGWSGFSHRARILALILPATWGSGQGRSKNGGSVRDRRGRGGGNRKSAVIVHKVAIITSTYTTGMGVPAMCTRVSIALAGMEMDRFCMCLYIIVYIPSDIADCNDACGM